MNFYIKYMKTNAIVSLVTWVDDFIDRGVTLANQKGTRQWVGDVNSFPDKFDVIQLFARASEAWLFSESHEPSVIGLGSAKHWQVPPKEMSFIWNELKALSLPSSISIGGGIAFPGSEWTHFGSNSWTLPSVFLRTHSQGTEVTLAAEFEPGRSALFYREYFHSLLNPGAMAPTPLHSNSSQLQNIPEKEAYIDYVNTIRKNIKDGIVEKVVAARSVKASFSSPVSIKEVLTNLHHNNATSTIFAVTRRGHTFVGASPEQLLSTYPDHFETMCLAGSAPRGATSYDDTVLAEALLQDSKSLREHHVVLDYIQDVIDPYCQEIESASHPLIKKLPTVQHLYTPIRGKLMPKTSIWSVVAALHPTPAVAGTPRNRALTLIQNEPFMRGWYAGIVGHLNLEGTGHFTVALRSALIEGATATLFAGCGIMEDSDPEKEYQESQWKMQVMMHALEIEDCK